MAVPPLPPYLQPDTYKPTPEERLDAAILAEGRKDFMVISLSPLGLNGHDIEQLKEKYYAAGWNHIEWNAGVPWDAMNYVIFRRSRPYNLTYEI